MQVVGFGSAELVGIATRSECLKNCGLIHSRGKRFFSSLQHPEWAHPFVSSLGTGDSFIRHKEGRA